MWLAWSIRLNKDQVLHVQCGGIPSSFIPVTPYMLRLGSYQASHIWTPALSETSNTTSVQRKVPSLTGVSPDIRKELVLSKHCLVFSHLSLLVTKSLPAKSVHLRYTEEAVKTSVAFSLNVLPEHQHAVLAKSWEVLERDSGRPVLEAPYRTS